MWELEYFDLDLAAGTAEHPEAPAIDAIINVDGDQMKIIAIRSSCHDSQVAQVDIEYVDRID